MLEEGKSSLVSGGVRGGLAPPEKTHRHLEMQHTLLGLLRQKSRASSGIHIYYRTKRYVWGPALFMLCFHMALHDNQP